ncbi:Hsp20/alpha crystallin family protein [Micromonospora sp. WMMA1363]|uniref:Hsp20/alpha crystallin family protein n=1 Tax=Micromonospora sp. WMMA1363 TaxID=3053985 RepID=UPI00259D2F1D|nr:Hsp20/alpha crystallin family protein [Micromonospora sp. WMMA1363]MDM4722875.1 Hsp20/alpha crystallin family protein [Micromonospora sp. WMMA1363]
MLTVRAERRPIDLAEQATTQLNKRPIGVFSRQMSLGDALDTEHIDAAYNNGVLVEGRSDVAGGDRREPRSRSTGGHRLVPGMRQWWAYRAASRRSC